MFNILKCSQKIDQINLEAEKVLLGIIEGNKNSLEFAIKHYKQEINESLRKLRNVNGTEKYKSFLIALREYGFSDTDFIFELTEEPKKDHISYDLYNKSKIIIEEFIKDYDILDKKKLINFFYEFLSVLTSVQDDVTIEGTNLTLWFFNLNGPKTGVDIRFEQISNKIAKEFDVVTALKIEKLALDFFYVNVLKDAVKRNNDSYEVKYNLYQEANIEKNKENIGKQNNYNKKNRSYFIGLLGLLIILLVFILKFYSNKTPKIISQKII